MIEEARGRKRIKEGLEKTGVGLLAVVTTPSPCGRDGEGSVVPFGLHTALCSEGGGYGREDSDEDVEDFSPGGIVVESSHSVKCWFCGLDISVLRLDFMNKVPVCSFSDAKIRHHFSDLYL